MHQRQSWFSMLAHLAAHWAGHPAAFLIAVLLIVIWAMLGPVFGYSDTWQLVVNTATTIVTFLMVFLIQNSQNRDTIAIHLKLDELVRAIHEARNSVLNLENLDEAELAQLIAQYQKLAEAENEPKTESATTASAPSVGSLAQEQPTGFHPMHPRSQR